MPLVATGITATQMGLGPLLECGAAVLMTVFGGLVGGLHIALAWRRGTPPLARVLWAAAGVTLLAGMVLALLYGVRFYAPVGWLHIPWMRAVHGSANALSVLAGLVGWVLAEPVSRGEAELIGP